MKLNIKKVATVLGSALMLGATAGMAAAASFTPSSFGDGGVAIVVGANAANSDLKAAVDLTSNLAGDLAAQAATVGGSTVTGGDSIKFEKSSTKFQLGKGVQDILNRDITSEDMKVLLKDGTYVDDDAEEFDFTQQINVANLSLGMFDDNDYKKDTPTLGFRIANNAEILNYSLEFTDEPSFNKLETTDLTMMGKTYYVLDVNSDNDTITLLDSADSLVVAEGETQTVTVAGQSYEISVSYIGQTQAKLTINGQTTNSLAAGQTQKLTGGAYVGVKDVLYSAKDSGVSKVEMSIGSGKLVLQDDTEVVMNDETITGLGSVITNSSGKLSSIKLTWSADGDQFIAMDSALTMPGFEAVKLNFAGMVFPTNEEIMIEAPTKTGISLKDFPLNDGTANINLAYSNAAGTAYVGVGADDDTVLRTVAPGQNLTFDANTDESFVASWTDGNDAESLLMRITNIRTVDNINKTTFETYSDGKWVKAKEDKKEGDSFTLGNIELTVGAINRVAQTVIVIPTNSNTNFNTLYSKAGMKVYLPYMNTTTYFNKANGTNYTADEACALISIPAQQIMTENFKVFHNSTAGAVNATCEQTSYDLIFSEEDKDNNPGDGKNITVTLGFNTASTPEVQVTDVTGMGSTEAEIGSTKVYESYVYSALATQILNDQDPDQDTVKLVYHGGESFGELYLTDVLSTVSAGSGSGSVSSLGAVTVYDTEVSSVSGKNLIVIGGSCINSVAAELLGGAACDAAFTAKTSIKAGEALIQSFTRGSKVALLVAGFNAADTTKAVTYLSNKPVNVTVGAKLKVTSATEATAITA